MGADGGINWVKVTGNAEEFYALVRPLGLLWEDSKCYDEYHDDYLEKNPLPKLDKGFYEISTYGSFNTNDGMDDLYEIIENLKSYLIEPKTDYDVWGDVNPLELSWKELLTEYHTTDYWKMGACWSLPAPMRIIVDQLNWVFDKNTDTIKEYDHPTFHITLREWLTRVMDVIDLKSFGSAETWT